MAVLFDGYVSNQDVSGLTEFIAHNTAEKIQFLWDNGEDLRKVVDKILLANGKKSSKRSR